MSAEAKIISKYEPSKNWPCFICFRKDLFEKSDNFYLIQIHKDKTNTLDYIKELQESLNFYNLLLREENRIREIATGKKIIKKSTPEDEERRRLRKIREQKKKEQLEIDRLLREQQDIEYKEVERLATEQKNQLELKQQAEEFELKKKIEEEKLKEILKQQEIELKHKNLKILKEKLPNEPDKNEKDIILIIFRLPNGERQNRRFRNNELVQILFDFIQTNEDIKFEYSDKFDIIRNLPFLELSENKNKFIGDVFDNSEQEVLYVKEIE